MPAYFTTYREGEKYTHLAHAITSDAAICGERVAGGVEIIPPIPLPS
jgi:hypothetical protein